MNFRLLLATVVALAATGRTHAQNSVPAVAAVVEPLSFNQTSGFGRAELTTSAGEKHIVYIPLNMQGFGEAVPFFNQEEDIYKSGTQPLFISADEVQMIYATVTGLYLEHMVVNGRHLHLLARRVLDGPVELFSCIRTRNAFTGPPGFQATPEVYAKQQWYIRWQGQLVEVLRGGFTKRMTAYFQDVPVIVEALANKKMGYDDMKMLVRLYNQPKSPTVIPVR